MTVTIAIACDRRILRDGIRRLLEARDGFEVVGKAADGECAVRIIRELRPRVAVIDAGLPGTSAIEVTRILRQHDIPTRVVMLAMRDDRSSREAALRGGASLYLEKSASSHELVRAVAAVGRPAGEEVPTPAASADGSHPSAGSGARRGVDALSDREREVLRLVAEGHSSKEIAVLLGLSNKTVETHRTNVMDKLGIRKVSGLVRLAIRDGLVTP